MRAFLFIFLLPLLSLARPMAPMPAIPGPFAVQTAEYKFPARLDADVLATAPTELWARVFWPTDLSKPRPIVFMLHGNHGTCRDHDGNDFNCAYTDEGVCPSGQTVVKNHEGFNYLGKQLASLGYIAVTINANRGITCGGSNDADWGLNLARGRLVLRHIELWQRWSTSGGSTAKLPVDFFGHVDLGNVGLLGHSRGGEGVRAVPSLYREAGSVWASRIPDLKIRGIFEIGAVDGQAGRVLDADDIAWNQIIPMCDGDVSDMSGRLPFERMLGKIAETRRTPKSLTMIYGANHNFFNTQWTNDESINCLDHRDIHGAGPTSPRQQSVAAIEASAFMLANVGADRDASYGSLFDPSFALPAALFSVTRVDRDHVYTYDRTFDAVVDDFDGVDGVSSNHVANDATGVTVRNNHGELPARADVSWTSPGGDVQLNWESSGGRDVSSFSFLDLRVGRPASTFKNAPTDFSIALVDASGALSAPVAASSYVTLDGPATRVNLYQTVRIPLGDFGLSAGARVRGVRLIFDRSASGSLHIANVRFSSNNVAAFLASRDLPLAPETIVATPPHDPNDTSGAGGVLDPVFTAPTKPGLSIGAPLKPVDGFNPNADVILKQAHVTRAEPVFASPYLNGRDGYELTVSGFFPAQDALPTLVIGSAQFSTAHYSGTGYLDRLIFSVPGADFAALPDQAAMRVQYGRGSAHQVWNLAPFVKSEIGR